MNLLTSLNQYFISAVILILVLFIGVSFLWVTPAAALSCASLEYNLENWIDNENVIVLSAQVDRNLDESPVTRQLLKEVDELQGELSVAQRSDTEVLFGHTETWGYGCSHEPLAEGQRGYFVLSEDDGELNVSEVFTEDDSRLQELLEAIGVTSYGEAVTGTSQAGNPVEPTATAGDSSNITLRQQALLLLTQLLTLLITADGQDLDLSISTDDIADRIDTIAAGSAPTPMAGSFAAACPLPSTLGPLGFQASNNNIPALQRFLNQDPDTRLRLEDGRAMVRGEETTFFGTATRDALARYHAKYMPQVPAADRGSLGPQTIQDMRARCGGGITAAPTDIPMTTTTDNTGTANTVLSGIPQNRIVMWQSGTPRVYPAANFLVPSYHLYDYEFEITPSNPGFTLNTEEGTISTDGSVPDGQYRVRLVTTNVNQEIARVFGITIGAVSTVGEEGGSGGSGLGANSVGGNDNETSNTSGTSNQSSNGEQDSSTSNTTNDVTSSTEGTGSDQAVMADSSTDYSEVRIGGGEVELTFKKGVRGTGLIRLGNGTITSVSQVAGQRPSGLTFNYEGNNIRFTYNGSYVLGKRNETDTYALLFMSNHTDNSAYKKAFKIRIEGNSTAGPSDYELDTTPIKRTVTLPVKDPIEIKVNIKLDCSGGKSISDYSPLVTGQVLGSKNGTSMIGSSCEIEYYRASNIRGDLTPGTRTVNIQVRGPEGVLGTVPIEITLE